MLSFNNTKIAFSDKSNNDLIRSYWLFKIVSYHTIVSIGNTLLNIALKIHLPIKSIIKATIFEQFCGGENIKECTTTIQTLGKSNIGTILDYSVEGKESEVDFDSNLKETLSTIQASKNNPNIPFCVFKATGFGRFDIFEKAAKKDSMSTLETAEFEGIKERIDTLCKAAHEAGTPIFIDAEQSWIQDTIDNIALEMMTKYNQEKVIVYTTIQMYRKRSLNYLEYLHNTAKDNHCKLGVKIVRGAYLEKERQRAFENRYPSPIHDNKESTDKNYNSGITFCLKNIESIACCNATHNEKSVLFTTELMNTLDIEKNHTHIYFAQLLGMSDHISYNLSNAGYNVAKYVPYGPVKEVIPYLIRRAQENTFVKGQTGRELDLISKEKKRRKLG